ncbi:MAG: 30S ribosomal protein S6 [Candidatus Pacebacteria bacterium]|nr:30S ribosomal protein S6 [Candidatus Paceibacterota bacterium]
MEEKKKDNETEIFGAGAVYELGYLLAPTIPNDEILSEIANLKSILEKQESIFLSGAEPKLIKLAYPITKIINGEKRIFETAYFAWMKFEIGKEKLAGLNKELDGFKHLLRYLLIYAPKKESLTRRPKKFSFIKEKADKIKVKATAVSSSILANDAQAVSKEKEAEKDLDKTIDNLIIK